MNAKPAMILLRGDEVDAILANPGLGVPFLHPRPNASNEFYADADEVRAWRAGRSAPTSGEKS